jgi:hypothetical protein
MIKTFRKIHYDLMEKNKTSKYFKCTIGEIVLVVIGILIALQINNWNENRKQNNQLSQYLQKFISELQEDLKVLKDLDSEHSIFRYNIMNYINYYNRKNPSIAIIIEKKDSAYYLIRTFNKRSFTPDKLSTTGNITLFSDEEKKSDSGAKRKS